MYIKVKIPKQCPACGEMQRWEMVSSEVVRGKGIASGLGYYVIFYFTGILGVVFGKSVIDKFRKKKKCFLCGRCEHYEEYID